MGRSTGKPAADVLEDYEFLTRHGVQKPEAAKRIGLSVSALERALQRAGRTQKEHN